MTKVLQGSVVTETVLYVAYLCMLQLSLYYGLYMPKIVTIEVIVMKTDSVFCPILYTHWSCAKNQTVTAPASSCARDIINAFRHI